MGVPRLPPLRCLCPALMIIDAVEGRVASTSVSVDPCGVGAVDVRRRTFSPHRAWRWARLHSTRVDSKRGAAVTYRQRRWSQQIGKFIHNPALFDIALKQGPSNSAEAAQHNHHTINMWKKSMGVKLERTAHGINVVAQSWASSLRAKRFRPWNFNMAFDSFFRKWGAAPPGSEREQCECAA